MKTLTMKGVIKFDPQNKTKKHDRQGKWKKIAMVFFYGDVCEYYSWFINRRFNLLLNKPLRGGHISFINDRDKPLTAYIFSNDKQQQHQWINEISAGSQGINDVIMFTAIPELAINGIGASGFGQYSGKVGFDNFSHLKSVLYRPFLKDLPLRFAPYSTLKMKLLRFIR